jgi:hypothetical protein
VVIHAGHRHAAVTHRLDQHAEPGQIRDVQHDDEVGPPKLLDRFRGAIDPRQVIEQEAEPGRGEARVGDHRVDALGAEQMDQADLAAEAVPVGVYVGRDADPLPGPECGGKGPSQRELFRRQRKRHFQKLTAPRGWREILFAGADRQSGMGPAVHEIDCQADREPDE